VIFVDSNVPMYLIGSEHPNKARARQVLGRLSARDALHLAVMARHGVDRIFTFDTGFDDVPGVTRVS
jgi:hypothetical protein